jgi:hypothetical protein
MVMHFFISFLLFLLVPACPVFTKYYLLRKVKSWKNLPSEKKTRIHKLSFIGSAVFLVIFVLYVTLNHA